MTDEAVRLREELDKTRRLCDDLREDNLYKEERIRELTAQLKEASSFPPRKYVYDAVIGEDGAKIFRWDLGSLKERRDEALERHRIAYEKRVGAASRSDSSQPDEGYDEIDSLKPLRD